MIPESGMKENTGTPLPTIDFLSKQLTYRRQHAGLKNELLARAIGKHPSEAPTIVDATAGLGRDSFILASLGFQITLLEREDALYEVLAAAIAAATPALPDIMQRMHLIHTDAITWLKALPPASRPDTIYLDPMFPSRKKSASVKKSMAIVQELLGNSSDNTLLFETALATATRRVIVKRPRTAAKISDHAVNFQLNGRTSRFDVYQL